VTNVEIGSAGAETGRADNGCDIDRAAELRAAMVADLLQRGALTSVWRPAVEHVARHRFIPDTIWTHDDASLSDRDLVPVCRARHTERWLTAAYADAFVITQVDDGAPDAQGRGEEITSSASMPAVVADMLAALRAEPGMRVLEIGTGTGWNAALLAHRLGPENVVSVEIDAALADAARARLERSGYGAVTVLTAADVEAASAHGPYDRLIATVAAPQIPPAWVARVRTGGIVLLPWGTDWYPCALLHLDVTGPGEARGRIVGSAAFMPLRDQRVPRAHLATELRERHPATLSTTELHPWHVAGDPHAATAIGIRLPGVRQYYVDDEDGARLIVIERDGQSWARLHLTDAAPYRVEQGGPRRLWEEVEAAYRWWQANGEPERGQWLVVIDGPEGQHVELSPAETDVTEVAGTDRA